MPASKYNLAVNHLGPLIAKLRPNGKISEDYHAIPKAEFVNAIMAWARPQIKEGHETIILQEMQDGKIVPVAEIKLLTNEGV